MKTRKKESKLILFAIVFLSLLFGIGGTSILSNAEKKGTEISIVSVGERNKRITIMDHSSPGLKKSMILLGRMDEEDKNNIVFVDNIYVPSDDYTNNHANDHKSYEFPRGSKSGDRLAKKVESIATGRKSKRMCFKYVKQAIKEELEVVLTGGSAYMASRQLAKSPYFKEVVVDNPKKLVDLPPGSIVVWDRTSGCIHGHISIKIEKGEASDHVGPQKTDHHGHTKYRVFIPLDLMS